MHKYERSVSRIRGNEQRFKSKVDTISGNLPILLLILPLLTSVSRHAQVARGGIACMGQTAAYLDRAGGTPVVLLHQKPESPAVHRGQSMLLGEQGAV